MEKITLNESIPVVCVTATSFPDGIMEAYEKLYRKVKNHTGRTTYGISTFSNGNLIYKAAFSHMDDDDISEMSLESDVISKGEYIAETIKNFEKHRDKFQPTFKKLGDSKYKTGMPGIEWYQGNNVKCMLPINN